jgi:ADP-ribose pyrophosphatase YjhB (NUDIX family)
MDILTQKMPCIFTKNNDHENNGMIKLIVLESFPKNGHVRHLNHETNNICSFSLSDGISLNFSFPGGKMDPRDRDLIQTAVRECHEELGVRSDHVDVWGRIKSGVPSVSIEFGFCWGYMSFQIAL